MRKYILSGVVIIFFIGFSIYFRLMGTPTTPVANNNPVEPTMPPRIVREDDDETRPRRLSPTPTVFINPTQLPSIPSPIVASTGLKDGSYDGNAADAFYGNIQVRVIISGGKIGDVQFLQYPNDRQQSININESAMPILKSEAIQAQSANVDIVSGATDSSQAFIQSLQSALNKAKG